MSALRPGDLLQRRYRLLEAHGETALWRGFLARDEGQPGAGADGDATLIIKHVRPELAHDEPSRAYVLRELTRVRILQHPAIVRPSEILVHEGTGGEKSGLLLIEPIQNALSQGLLLHRMVAFRRDEGDRFRSDEVRRIGVQLASALAYVHGQLLCHGDLRLESVLLRPEGVRLCDVGLGRALPRGPYLDAVGRAGEAPLLAPEVRTGRPPDVRSDVFGLGAIYRHLLSMGEDSAWAAFQAEQPGLAAIIGRAIDAEPQGRYPSVEAFVADVEAVALTGAPVRRRHSPTPVALAVAAGRLPVEELSRPQDPGDPTRRRDSGEMDAVVLAPLSTSTSARISMPPKAPRSSVPPGAPASERALSGAPRAPAAPQPLDDDAQPTRQVRKSDAAELQRGDRGPDPSDIGAHFTLPAARLSAAELSPSTPPRRPQSALPPEGAAVLDHTALAPRLDPEDAPTTAVPRVDLPEDPRLRVSSDEVAMEGPPTVKVDDADILAARAALAADPAAAVLFKDLPLRSPAPDDAPTGLHTPPPLGDAPQPPRWDEEPSRPRATSGAPRPASGARPPSGGPRSTGERPPMSSPRVSARHAASGEGTPTRPMPLPPSQGTPRRGSPMGRMTIVAALVLAAAVGALGAVLAVSLLGQSQRRDDRRGPAPKTPEAPAAPDGQGAPRVAPPPAAKQAPATRAAAPPAPAMKAPAPPPAAAARAPAPPAAAVPAPAAPMAAAPPQKPMLASGGCPAGMVAVSGSATFCIDQHEQPGAGQRPRTGVSYKDAEAACLQLGRRLCSDAEWEAACRGKGRASYPYGQDVRDGLCNTRGGALAPAGARPTCVSAAGAYDMAGNAAEWVRGGGLRGGSAIGDSDGRCSVRLKLPAGGASPFTGFRCCK